MRRAIAAIGSLFLVMAFCALAACASDADTRRQADQALQSWSSTVHAVAEQWADGHVPARYGRAALDRAREEVQKALASLPPGRDSEPLRDRGRQLVSEIDRLSAAIARDDAGAARAARAVPGR